MQLLNQTLCCLLNKARYLLVSLQKTVQAEGTGIIYELPDWVGPQLSNADSQMFPDAQQPWVNLQEQSLTGFKKPKKVHKQVVCQSKQTRWPNGMLRAAVNVQGSTDIYKVLTVFDCRLRLHVCCIHWVENPGTALTFWPYLPVLCPSPSYG